MVGVSPQWPQKMSGIDDKTVKEPVIDEDQEIASKGHEDIDETRRSSLEQQEEDLPDDLSDGEESEESDDEPQLVYDRVRGEIPKIVSTDAISSVAVHSKFMAVGSHWGKILILDHLGNKVQPDVMLTNGNAVTQISIDAKGEFIAAASGNKAFITGLLTSDYNYLLRNERNINAIAIDPFFASSSERRFVAGDDRVTLHFRNFFGKYVKTEIRHPDGGTVMTIKWSGESIAWATDSCVRVYDVGLKAMIAFFKKDHDQKLRPEIYPCCLFFSSPRDLLIAWGDAVKVCKIKDRDMQRPQTLSQYPDQPAKYMEVTNMFVIDFCVAGISLFDKNSLLLLTVDKDVLESTGSAPQMLIVQPQGSQEYIEISHEIILPKQYQSNQCKDYQLESLIDDGIYFIVSPRDIIFGKQREDDDHITWLLERKKFSAALEAIKSSRNLRKYTLSQVGQQYMDFLIERGFEEDIEAAAALSPSVCGKSKSLWDQVFKTFDAIDRLQSLAPYLPTKDFILPHEVYETVLKSFMKDNSTGFLKTIKSWPSKDLYRSDIVIHDCMDVLQYYPKNEDLLRGLAVMYSNESRHDKSLEIYLQIGDHDQVFELISRFDLYDTLKERLEFLMQLNPREASKLLLDKQDRIPIDHVIAKLKSKPELLWVYMDRVVQKDSEAIPEHHDTLVGLYARHSPDKLLSFLKMSNHYSLEAALTICQELERVHEMVFLLARMGNTKEALHYITDSLDNIDWAVEFCKEQDDRELWDDLINLSMKKQAFIRALLSNIGTNIPDPISLIEKIPEGMDIPGLKDALIKILDDFKLQVSLEERSKRVLQSDNFSILDKLLKQRRKPHIVDDKSLCSGCSRPVISSRVDLNSDLILFNCKHVFHEDCLPVREDSEPASCTFCTGNKRSLFLQWEDL